MNPVKSLPLQKADRIKIILMKRPSLLIVLLVLCSTYWMSCQKTPLGTGGSTPWKSSWLFPAVKGDVSLANLKELRNNKFTHLIPALSLGMPTGVPLNLPGVTINHVGPFPQRISSWLYRANIDSFDLDISLQNLFPIPIGAGTKIVFRNDADTLNPANIIYSYSIPNDVAPHETFTINLKVINKTIEDTVFIYLDQFTSPGGNNVVFDPQPSLLTVTLKVLIMKSIEIYSNKQFVSTDTLGVSFGSSLNNQQQNNGLTDTTATGQVHVYLENYMPVNTGIQVYFLNADKTAVIDSLFTNRLSIAGATTDGTGEPLNQTNSETGIEITADRIRNIKSSTYCIFNFKFDTNGYPPPKVVANTHARLKIQITGDLNININF